MIPFFQPKPGGRSVVVTVSGELSIQDNGGGSGATAGIRWNADGTVDKREGLTYTQLSPATDWIIPNELASGSYEVRYTGLTGDAFTVGASSEDAWIALSAGREYYISEGGASVKNTSCTFEIRVGTTTLGSATYTFEADNT